MKMQKNKKTGKLSFKKKCKPGEKEEKVEKKDEKKEFWKK